MTDVVSSELKIEPPNPEQSIRDDLITTAVKFLQNPKVIRTSLADQQKFLKRKGLTEEEIQIACDKSGAYAFHDERNRVPPSLPLPVTYNNSVVQISLFDRIKEIVHSAAIFSVVIYAVYKFYENFIAPFLFGRKKKTVEDSLDELEKTMRQSMSDLQSNVASVKVEVDKISQGAESSTQRQLLDLKSEVATVKGLLLSRSQFPSVSKSSLVRPSIPEWQKSSITQDSDPDSDPERKTEEFSEVGSGSGSSEHEHQTKTSDSSLDVISFSSKDSDFQRLKCKEEDDKD